MRDDLSGDEHDGGAVPDAVPTLPRRVDAATSVGTMSETFVVLLCLALAAVAWGAWRPRRRM
jgi:hypothetical protein